MDKKLILAVAGSGKTTTIIRSISLDKRSLIVTYTNNNLQNLRSEIVNRFGYLPQNISLMTYFTFIHSFCYLPFLKDKYRTTGLDYRKPNKFAEGEMRYITKESRRLYSNRIAKFIIENDIIDAIINRIERYFDNFFIDEIQDFAGHDFNFLSQISKLERPLLYVGDYFQHTYDTSRDGTVNRNLHSSLDSFKQRVVDMGLEIDEQTLSHSYRCCPEVCEFVSEKLKINIQSHRSDKATINYVDNPELIKEIIQDDSVVKLFYQQHYQYACYSQNWGGSKGENKYNDICVILNDSTLRKYQSNNLCELPNITRNKLYVALTRANGSITLVPQKLLVSIERPARSG